MSILRKVTLECQGLSTVKVITRRQISSIKVRKKMKRSASHTETFILSKLFTLRKEVSVDQLFHGFDNHLIIKSLFEEMVLSR